jgi:hypothetical protein
MRGLRLSIHGSRRDADFRNGSTNQGAPGQMDAADIEGDGTAARRRSGRSEATAMGQPRSAKNASDKLVGSRCARSYRGDVPWARGGRGSREFTIDIDMSLKCATRCSAGLRDCARSSRLRPRRRPSRITLSRCGAARQDDLKIEPPRTGRFAKPGQDAMAPHAPSTGRTSRPPPPGRS